jgi:hypothetical protein
MLFTTIIALCTEKFTKHLRTPRGPNAGFFFVKAVDKYVIALLEMFARLK